MDEKTMIEIMLLCKGWYDHQKYNDVLYALSAYYHKYYGCPDIVVDEGFALSLFLKPLVVEAVKRKPALISYIFEEPASGIKSTRDFEVVMYKRCLHLICMIPAYIFDISDYNDKIKECRETGAMLDII